jgi:hypothetical protein
MARPAWALARALAQNFLFFVWEKEKKTEKKLEKGQNGQTNKVNKI